MLQKWLSRGTLGDLLAVFALLSLACLPFTESLLDSRHIPAGLDLLQHYSRESVIRLALGDGKLPLWNPYEFSGFPVQADLQTGVFYPPSVILRALPLPLFLTWTVVFHVWTFGVGEYVLCRTLGVGRGSAAIAAVGLMLGGITMPRVYAGHLDVLRTVAWIPLVLALAVRSVDRATVRPKALLVVALSLQILAGFVQLAVYTMACLTLYAAFSAIWPSSGARSWRHAGLLVAQVVLAIVSAVGLTAFQGLPTVQLVSVAGRTGGVPFDEAVIGAIGGRELLYSIMPFVSGPDVPFESWETTAYVGIVLSALAPVALFLRRRRVVAFYALLGGLALGLATGGPLYRLHHWVFPMFRIPGRLACFWAIAVCTLGAIALDRLTDRLAAKAGADGVPRSWLLGHLRLEALIVVGLMTSLDVSSYARRFVQTRAFADRFATALPFVPSRYGRVLSLCETRLYSGELSALGVPSVDGYNSYFLRNYARFALTVRGEPPDRSLAAYPRIGAVPTLSDAELTLLSLLNVTEIVSCDPIELAGLTLIARQEPFYVYRNTRAAGRALPVCSDVSVLDVAAATTILEGARHGCGGAAEVSTSIADTVDGRLLVRVSAPKPLVLLLSEPFYPERRARIDGVTTQIRRMAVALSAVTVPAGVHVVQLRLVPSSLYAGTALSVVTVLGWGMTALVRRRARAHPQRSGMGHVKPP